jgi:hypothetical protein
MVVALLAVIWLFSYDAVRELYVEDEVGCITTISNKIRIALRHFAISRSHL